MKFALLAACGLVAFASAVFGGFTLSVGDRPILETATAYSRALRGGESADKPVFLKLPPVTANLRSSADGRFIQLAVTLQTDQAQKQSAEWLAPHVVDSLQQYLRGLDERAIEGSAGMEKLRRDLRQRVAALDSEQVVEKVLIRKLAVQ